MSTEADTDDEELGEVFCEVCGSNQQRMVMVKCACYGPRHLVGCHTFCMAGDQWRMAHITTAYYCHCCQDLRKKGQKAVQDYVVQRADAALGRKGRPTEPFEQMPELPQPVIASRLHPATQPKPTEQMRINAAAKAAAAAAADAPRPAPSPRQARTASTEEAAVARRGVKPPQLGLFSKQPAAAAATGRASKLSPRQPPNPAVFPAAAASGGGAAAATSRGGSHMRLANINNRQPGRRTQADTFVKGLNTDKPRVVTAAAKQARTQAQQQRRTEAAAAAASAAAAAAAPGYQQPQRPPSRLDDPPEYRVNIGHFCLSCQMVCQGLTGSEIGAKRNDGGNEHDVSKPVLELHGKLKRSTEIQRLAHPNQMKAFQEEILPALVHTDDDAERKTLMGGVFDLDLHPKITRYDNDPELSYKPIMFDPTQKDRAAVKEELLRLRRFVVVTLGHRLLVMLPTESGELLMLLPRNKDDMDDLVQEVVQSIDKVFGATPQPAAAAAAAEQQPQQQQQDHKQPQQQQQQRGASDEAECEDDKDKVMEEAQQLMCENAAPATAAAAAATNARNWQQQQQQQQAGVGGGPQAMDLDQRWQADLHWQDMDHDHQQQEHHHLDHHQDRHHDDHDYDDHNQDDPDLDLRRSDPDPDQQDPDQPMFEESGMDVQGSYCVAPQQPATAAGPRVVQPLPAGMTDHYRQQQLQYAQHPAPPQQQQQQYQEPPSIPASPPAAAAATSGAAPAISAGRSMSSKAATAQEAVLGSTVVQLLQSAAAAAAGSSVGQLLCGKRTMPQIQDLAALHHLRVYMVGFPQEQLQPGSALFKLITAAANLGVSINCQSDAVQHLCKDLKIPPTAAAAAGSSGFAMAGNGHLTPPYSGQAAAAAAAVVADTVDLTGDDDSAALVCKHILLLPYHAAAAVQDLLGDIPLWRILTAPVVILTEGFGRGLLQYLYCLEQQQQQLGAAVTPMQQQQRSIPSAADTPYPSPPEEGEILNCNGTVGSLKVTCHITDLDRQVPIRLPVDLSHYQLYNRGLAVVVDSGTLKSCSLQQIQQLLMLLQQCQQQQQRWWQQQQPSVLAAVPFSWQLVVGKDDLDTISDDLNRWRLLEPEVSTGRVQLLDDILAPGTLAEESDSPPALVTNAVALAQQQQQFLRLVIVAVPDIDCDIKQQQQTPGGSSRVSTTPSPLAAAPAGSTPLAAAAAAEGDAMSMPLDRRRIDPIFRREGAKNLKSGSAEGRILTGTMHQVLMLLEKVTTASGGPR